VSAGARERLVIAPRLRRRAIVAAIRTARERLVLSIFRCDDRVVRRALADAARRGVRVSVLMTARARAAGRALEELQAWLAAHGIEVRRFAGGMKYHAKYLVADGRLAVVTTLNLTGRCFSRTCDFTLVTHDPAVVSGLAELFAADWAARPVAVAPAQRERLFVGPDQSPRTRFAALVGEARARIRILDAKLSDDELVTLLERRQRTGISVDIARRRDVRVLRRHGKLLIVDGTAAIIGSLALSRRGLDRRRELAVVIRDPRLVAQLDAFWCTHVRLRPHAAGATAATGRLELVS
jgi:phosphatidylserine/phosphatidylglycerophosphate/cardiolipin synthase-like enzyme